VLAQFVDAPTALQVVGAVKWGDWEVAVRYIVVDVAVLSIALWNIREPSQPEEEAPAWYDFDSIGTTATSADDEESVKGKSKVAAAVARGVGHVGAAVSACVQPSAHGAVLFAAVLVHVVLWSTSGSESNRTRFLHGSYSYWSAIRAWCALTLVMDYVYQFIPLYTTSTWPQALGFSVLTPHHGSSWWCLASAVCFLGASHVIRLNAWPQREHDSDGGDGMPMARYSDIHGMPDDSDSEDVLPVAGLPPNRFSKALAECAAPCIAFCASHSHLWCALVLLVWALTWGSGLALPLLMASCALWHSSPHAFTPRAPLILAYCVLFLVAQYVANIWGFHLGVVHDAHELPHTMPYLNALGLRTFDHPLPNLLAQLFALVIGVASCCRLSHTYGSVDGAHTAAGTDQLLAGSPNTSPSSGAITYGATAHQGSGVLSKAAARMPGVGLSGSMSQVGSMSQAGVTAMQGATEETPLFEAATVRHAHSPCISVTHAWPWHCTHVATQPWHRTHVATQPSTKPELV